MDFRKEKKNPAALSDRILMKSENLLSDQHPIRFNPTDP